MILKNENEKRRENRVVFLERERREEQEKRHRDRYRGSKSGRKRRNSIGARKIKSQHKIL